MNKNKTSSIMAKINTPPVSQRVPISSSESCCNGQGYWIDRNNGHLMVGNVDTGLRVVAKDGQTPYIGDNDNWWVGGKDTGHSSMGMGGVSAFQVWKETEGVNHPEIQTPEQWIDFGYGFFTIEEKSKLDGLDTQSEIDSRILNSKRDAVNEVKADVYLKTQTYNRQEVNKKIDDVNKGVNGSISPEMTLPQLNLLTNGVWECSTSGVYANGLTAKEGFSTRFEKNGTTWRLFSEVEANTDTYDGFNSDSRTKPGSANNDKVLFDELNIGSVSEIPNGYKDMFWNIPLSEGYKYYNSKCLVSDVSHLSGINIVVNNPGNIKILAVGLDGFTIHSETKTATVGVNTFNFLDTTLLDTDFYVGIEIIAGGAQMKSSTVTSSSGSEMWSPYNIVNYTSIAYPFAYSIELTSGGLKGKVELFQHLIKSDTTNIQESLAKYGKITLDAKVFVIEETINMPNGSTLDGAFGKSVLIKGSGLSGDIINVENKEDVLISNIRLKGDLPAYAYEMNGITSGVGIVGNESEALSNTYMGSNNGLKVKSSERVVLENIQFHNINGVGMLVDGAGKDYIHGLKASKLFFYNCYKGLEAKSEHEYSNYSDLMVSLCQVGVDVSSGNLSLSHPILTRCRVGMIYRKGYNEAHGVVTGAEIKHHQLAGLLVDNVTNGQMFDSLQMQYADLVIRNSRGIIIPNLFFTNGKLVCSGGTGKNVIQNIYFDGAPVIDNTGNLVINNSVNWGS